MTKFTRYPQIKFDIKKMRQLRKKEDNISDNGICGIADINKAVQAYGEFLNAIGISTDREGLTDTPQRYVKFMLEFLNPPPFKLTTFASEGYDEMIISKDIPFVGLCEHHCLPFSGIAHIGYAPNGKIVGISKLARTLEWYSRRLQNQERITQQVANELYEKLKPKGVAVILEAEHSCMTIRGIKKPGSKMVTSCLLGCFKNEPETRQEFMKLIGI